MALISNGINQYSWHNLTAGHNSVGAFSVAVKFRTGSTVSGVVQTPLLITKATGYARGVGVEISAAGDIRGFCEDGSRRYSGSLGTAAPNTVYTFVVTRDATSTGIANFYLNTIATTSSRGSNIADTLTRIISGATYSAGYGEYFGGKVIDVAFWTSKLSSSDISVALNLAQSPDDCSVLPQDYWSAVANDTPTIGSNSTVRTGTTYDADDFVTPSTEVNSFTNPVEAGGTLYFTTSGFTTLSAITTNQANIAVSGITGVDGSADVLGWANNVPYPDLPASITYTFTDGVVSASANGSVVKPAAYTRLVVETPVLTAGYLAGDILAQTGRTHVSGDIMFHTTYDDFSLAADTGYTVSSEGSIDLWVRVAAGADAGKMFYYAVTITESGVVIEDTTPTASSFGSVTGADITTLTTLPDVVTISGVTAAVDIPAIPASGTEYRVSTNSGSSYGDWTSATTNVQLGFMLQARKMSSGSYSTPTTARVTVGGVNFDGTITTVSADNEPDVLIFTSFTDAEVLSEHTSATVAVTGMSVGETSTFTVANGTYSKNGGSFISTAGTMQNGDTFALRGTSDQYFGRSKDVILTAANGPVVSTYRITNKLDPLLPTGGGSTVVGQFLTGYTL